MSSVWSSQGAVLATAVAVSGTMILLLLSRDKASFLENTTKNQDSGGGGCVKSGRVVRSCLSSGKKNGRSTKKVRFSVDVKESSAKSDEYKKAHREVVVRKHVSYGTQTIFDGVGADMNPLMRMKFSN